MSILDRMFGVKDEGKVESTQDQPDDDKKIASFVRDRVEECRMNTSRISSEGIWMTNIAYLLGYDGLFFDVTTRQFRSINRGTASIRRNRIHSNKILPSVQNRLSRLCKSPPKYDVRPNSNEVDDKDQARLSVKVLDHYWDYQRINDKRIDLYMWLQQCGHSYVKVCFDDTLGKEVMDPMTGEMMKEGDIRVDAVSAFEIFPDPMARDLDEAQWIVHAKVRKLDYFRQHYPERGPLVQPEDVWLLSAQYQQRINTINVRGQGQTGSQVNAKNSAIEMVYYERASKKYPKGRMIAVANGVKLEDKELPCGDFPIVKFDDVKIAGKFYSESLITHARPLQDQLNRTLSKRAEWTNKVLAGKFIGAKGHSISIESLNDQSGEFVQYTPVPNAPEPHAMQIPVMPQYAYNEEERLQNGIYDIFGINEVSRGQVPASGIPAIGMQFLMEQDDTRIGVVTEQHEQAWAKVGQLILKYAHHYVKTERLLKQAGKLNEYVVEKWKGDDLSSDPDVIVIRGSTLPGSKVLKRQEVMNLYGQGLLGDPMDPRVKERVLSMLEFGDVAEAWEDIALDEAQIQRSIDAIETQMPPEMPNELDNNELHVRKKNQLRKSEKFNKLSPESQAMLMQDIQMRIDLLVDQAVPQAKQELEQIQNDINQFNQMPGEPEGPPMPVEEDPMLGPDPMEGVPV